MILNSDLMLTFGLNFALTFDLNFIFVFDLNFVLQFALTRVFPFVFFNVLMPFFEFCLAFFKKVLILLIRHCETCESKSWQSIKNSRPKIKNKVSNLWGTVAHERNLICLCKSFLLGQSVSFHFTLCFCG